MAYVSQEMKKELAPAIKAVLKKYRMKGSIAVNNHSTLEVNLSEGYVDCISKGPKYFNNDDAMTDYFSRSHYTDINIGKWNKPFVLKESK